MIKVSFSKLYNIYTPMRDFAEENLKQAREEYKKNKTNENKKNVEAFKREFEMMNKVINSLYYCGGGKRIMKKYNGKLLCAWCGDEIKKGDKYVLDEDNEPQCLECAEQQIIDSTIIYTGGDE